MRLSRTTAWKKVSERKSGRQSSGLDEDSKSSLSGFELATWRIERINDDLMPFGGSLVSLIELYRIECGKVAQLIEVSHSLNSGCGALGRFSAATSAPFSVPLWIVFTKGYSWSTIWASSDMKLGAKWQF